MQTIGQIIGFFFACFLLRLAYKFFRKEKYPTCTMLASIGALILLCSFPWFEGWAKSFIASKITSKFEDLGKQVTTVQETTTEMQKHLDKNQAELDKNQKELANTQTNIQSEQKRIEDVEFLVKNLFSKMTYESVEGEDTQKVFLFPFPVDKDKQILLIKLDNFAIPSSIQCSGTSLIMVGTTKSFGIMQQYKNVAYTYVSGSFHFRNLHFEIQYVKDVNQTNLVQKIEFRTNDVFIDNIETKLIRKQEL